MQTELAETASHGGGFIFFCNMWSIYCAKAEAEGKKYTIAKHWDRHSRENKSTMAPHRYCVEAKGAKQKNWHFFGRSKNLIVSYYTQERKGKGRSVKEMNTNYAKSVERMFDVYCRTIIKNRAINYRKAFDRVCYHESSPVEEAITEHCDFRPKQWMRYRNETLVIRDETLYSAVRQLPDEQKKIVILYYGGEMSDSNIASEMGIPKSTVNYKRNSAIRFLRTVLRLEDYYA